MTQETILSTEQDGIKDMLATAGYSAKAIKYYTEKPYMGTLPNADQCSEMVGSCGDTMEVYLKVEDNVIQDVRYQVMGCAGAVSAAMAAVDIVKGKTISEAKNLTDGDVFRLLEEIPVKKHHCIQLAVKTFLKAIDEYEESRH
jgi:nitrogen fixation NifU-like protein